MPFKAVFAVVEAVVHAACVRMSVAELELELKRKWIGKEVRALRGGTGVRGGGGGGSVERVWVGLTESSSG